MTALEAAHEELRAELAAAYRLDAEGHDMFDVLQVVIPIEDIVDHARRIHLDTASVHYRAEKAKPLLRSALQLQAVTLEQYARTEGAQEVPVEQKVDRIHELARDLEDQIAATVARMWEVARG